VSFPPDLLPQPIPNTDFLALVTASSSSTSNRLTRHDCLRAAGSLPSEASKQETLQFGKASGYFVTTINERRQGKPNTESLKEKGYYHGNCIMQKVVKEKITIHSRNPDINLQTEPGFLQPLHSLSPGEKEGAHY
jgi:hypothetical protein